MLRISMAWCDQRYQILGVTRQIAGSITAQEGGGAQGNVMNKYGLVRRVLVKAMRVGITSLLCGNRNVLKPQVCFEDQICRFLHWCDLADCRIYCHSGVPEML